MALVEKPEIETSVLTLKSHQYILAEVNAHKVTLCKRYQLLTRDPKPSFWFQTAKETFKGA
jgi:hypothetical protein